MEMDTGATHSDSSFESWFSSDTSSGYLEDAIAGWGIWNKQKNSPCYSQNQEKSHCLDDHFDCSSRKTQLLDDYCSSDCPNSKNRSSKLSFPNDMHLAAIKQDAPQRSWASRDSDENNDASVPKGQWKKIAYPFELVKSGGVEGETTLKDINSHMLMSPSKPIPHPVSLCLGDSVARPLPSPRSFGMSGKEVIALTRIHTQGRGSITIMRTKG